MPSSATSTMMPTSRRRVAPRDGAEMKSRSSRGGAPRPPNSMDAHSRTSSTDVELPSWASRAPPRFSSAPGPAATTTNSRSSHPATGSSRLPRDSESRRRRRRRPAHEQQDGACSRKSSSSKDTPHRPRPAARPTTRSSSSSSNTAPPQGATRGARAAPPTTSRNPRRPHEQARFSKAPTSSGFSPDSSTRSPRRLHQQTRLSRSPTTGNSPPPSRRSPRRPQERARRLQPPTSGDSSSSSWKPKLSRADAEADLARNRQHNSRSQLSRRGGRTQHAKRPQQTRNRPQQHTKTPTKQELKRLFPVRNCRTHPPYRAPEDCPPELADLPECADDDKLGDTHHMSTSISTNFRERVPLAPELIAWCDLQERVEEQIGEMSERRSNPLLRKIAFVSGGLLCGSAGAEDEKEKVAAAATDEVERAPESLDADEAGLVDMGPMTWYKLGRVPCEDFEEEARKYVESFWSPRLQRVAHKNINEITERFIERRHLAAGRLLRSASTGEGLGWHEPFVCQVEEPVVIVTSHTPFADGFDFLFAGDARHPPLLTTSDFHSFSVAKKITGEAFDLRVFHLYAQSTRAARRALNLGRVLKDLDHIAVQVTDNLDELPSVVESVKADAERKFEDGTLRGALRVHLVAPIIPETSTHSRIDIGERIFAPHVLGLPRDVLPLLSEKNYAECGCGQEGRGVIGGNYCQDHSVFHGSLCTDGCIHLDTLFACSRDALDAILALNATTIDGFRVAVTTSRREAFEITSSMREALDARYVAAELKESEPRWLPDSTPPTDALPDSTPPMDSSALCEEKKESEVTSGPSSTPPVEVCAPSPAAAARVPRVDVHGPSRTTLAPSPASTGRASQHIVSRSSSPTLLLLTCPTIDALPPEPTTVPGATVATPAVQPMSTPAQVSQPPLASPAHSVESRDSGSSPQPTAAAAAPRVEEDRPPRTAPASFVGRAWHHNYARSTSPKTLPLPDTDAQPPEHTPAPTTSAVTAVQPFHTEPSTSPLPPSLSPLAMSEIIATDLVSVPSEASPSAAEAATADAAVAQSRSSPVPLEAPPAVVQVHIAPRMTSILSETTDARASSSLSAVSFDVTEQTLASSPVSPVSAEASTVDPALAPSRASLVPGQSPAADPLPTLSLASPAPADVNSPQMLSASPMPTSMSHERKASALVFTTSLDLEDLEDAGDVSVQSGATSHGVLLLSPIAHRPRGERRPRPNSASNSSFDFSGCRDANANHDSDANSGANSNNDANTDHHEANAASRRLLSTALRAESSTPPSAHRGGSPLPISRAIRVQRSSHDTASPMGLEPPSRRPRHTVPREVPPASASPVGGTEPSPPSEVVDVPCEVAEPVPSQLSSALHIHAALAASTDVVSSSRCHIPSTTHPASSSHLDSSRELSASGGQSPTLIPTAESRLGRSQSTSDFSERPQPLERPHPCPISESIDRTLLPPASASLVDTEPSPLSEIVDPSPSPLTEVEFSRPCSPYEREFPPCSHSSTSGPTSSCRTPASSTRCTKSSRSPVKSRCARRCLLSRDCVPHSVRLSTEAVRYLKPSRDVASSQSPIQTASASDYAISTIPSPRACAELTGSAPSAQDASTPAEYAASIPAGHDQVSSAPAPSGNSHSGSLESGSQPTSWNGVAVRTHAERKRKQSKADALERRLAKAKRHCELQAQQSAVKAERERERHERERRREREKAKNDKRRRKLIEEREERRRLATLAAHEAQERSRQRNARSRRAPHSHRPRSDSATGGCGLSATTRALLVTTGVFAATALAAYELYRWW